MADEKKEEIDTISENPFEKKSQELEKKLGDLTKEKEKMEEALKQADILGNVVDAWTKEDPKGLETLKKQYAKIYGSPVVPEREPVSEQPEKKPTKEVADDMDNGKIKEVDEKLNKVTATQREQVIKDFEEKAGIDQLPDEERKEARRNIEAHLNVFGQSVQTAPIETLNTVLKESYKVVAMDKAVKNNGYEAAADAYRNLSGSMPTMSSRNLPTEEETGNLTPKQKVWADKLGVDPKKAEEANKAKDVESKRVPEAEKKIKK